MFCVPKVIFIFIASPERNSKKDCTVENTGLIQLDLMGRKVSKSHCLETGLDRQGDDLTSNRISNINPFQNKIPIPKEVEWSRWTKGKFTIVLFYGIFS